jgi:hypothetical protein
MLDGIGKIAKALDDVDCREVEMMHDVDCKGV